MLKEEDFKHFIEELSESLDSDNIGVHPTVFTNMVRAEFELRVERVYFSKYIVKQDGKFIVY